jgi:glycosyltransferase involved in cell wall biosynthesis/GT2 family glycosyltransferase
VTAALDYRSGGTGIAADSAPGRVDVVIPVHGAAAEFARCLASVVAHTDLGRHRLVVVLDGPGQDEARAALGRVPPGAAVTVIENERQLGFVASANKGMAVSDRDVVLLNSDTEVTAGWLEKLQAAAYSDAAVATVTPFSNNATLCSLPRSFVANALPAGLDADGLGRLVEERSRREYPRIPTGVGVCLYVKRKVLDAIGPLDEARFGRGYGEENDFCMRALRAGYVHVLDDATFIYHAGQRSFGPSRDARVRRAQTTLRRLHPGYLPTIAAFMREDPLRPARERVTDALRPPRRALAPGLPRSVVHVVHGWPPWNSAGTEMYARGLALRQARDREVAVFARIADPARRRGEVTEVVDGGARVRLLVNNFLQRDPLSRNALVDRRLQADFSRFLDEQRPELVHVHHLAGHAAGLATVLRARRLPFVFQVQDWWEPCARTNLLLPTRELCSGPGAAKCSRCLPLTRIPPASLTNRALYRWRWRILRKALGGADAVVMGSRFIAESYRDLGWLPEGARVIPYGVETAAAKWPRRVPALPLRFAVIGSVMPHKGVHVAVEAFRGMPPDRATLDIWGDGAVLPDYARELQAAASPAVRLRGSFPESEKDAVYAGMDVLVVPSLGLESFGLVVHEAAHRGVPVLASRRGALIEAAGGEEERGALFTPGRADELRALVDRLCAHPELVARWSEAASRAAVKTLDAHALEIDDVYRDVLAGRSGR